MTWWRCFLMVFLLLGAGRPAAVLAQSGAASTSADSDAQTATAVGGSGGLVVGGIRVDTTGKSPEDARQNGWREAQRLAWPALWARMSGEEATTAPKLADSALDGIVSAIEIEQEEVGPKRYVAKLAVVFDRVRTSKFLGRYSAVNASPPFLVIPVLQAAGTRMAYEENSPWLAAWTRLRAGETPVDYVRIQPTPGDVILLNAWQTERRHLFLWRMLIDRYQVADVLIPELILDQGYVGGPVTAELIARLGTHGRVLGRARLRNRAGNLRDLLDTAVAEADRIYVEALRAGNLIPDPKLIPDEDLTAELEDTGPQFGGTFQTGAWSPIRVEVATPDDATLQAMQRRIAATPGVLRMRVQSLILGGDSVFEITPAVPPDELRYALDQQGLRLTAGRLRPRQPDEAPLPPPAGEPRDQPLQEVTVPSETAPPPAATPSSGSAGRPQ